MNVRHRRRAIPPSVRTTLVALPLLAFAIVGLLAPLLAPADPTATDLAASLLPPSAEHPSAPTNSAATSSAESCTAPRSPSRSRQRS